MPFTCTEFLGQRSRVRLLWHREQTEASGSGGAPNSATRELMISQFDLLRPKQKMVTGSGFVLLRIWSLQRVNTIVLPTFGCIFNYLLWVQGWGVVFAAGFESKGANS
jgi:hypothetical protein